ncbi:MAG: DNA-binding response OmpR family regulator [Bacteriovoracaceae bacterium]|jgi:DNA-binding response OmpR family regulator
MSKILIVSETNIVTKSIIAFCKKHGDEIVHVRTGSEAMGELFNTKFDLFISSLIVEELDGFQMISTVKSSQMVNSLTPIVLITSGEDVELLFSDETKPDFIIKKDEETMVEFEKAYQAINSGDAETKINLLYIDDDRFVQKMITMWLSKIDYINLVVCGSVEDVKGYLDEDFDIIVSDNILGDGEFADIVKLVQSSKLVNTPIIIYTGTVAKLNIDEVKKTGNILDVLPKPFEMKSFLQKIEFIKKLKK